MYVCIYIYNRYIYIIYIHTHRTSPKFQFCPSRSLWYHSTSSPHCPQGGRGFLSPGAARGAGQRRAHGAAELPRQRAHVAGGAAATAAGFHGGVIGQ